MLNTVERHAGLCRPFNKLGWKVAFVLNYFIIVVYSAFTVGGIFFSIQRIVQQVRISPDSRMQFQFSYFSSILLFSLSVCMYTGILNHISAQPPVW